MNIRPWLRAVFAVLGVLIGIALVIDKQNSNLALWNLIGMALILALPIALLLLVVAGKWKVIIHFVFVPFLVGWLTNMCFDFLHSPPGIRWSFGSPPGSSGSYHVLQFYQKIGDTWNDGPTVEGWPMKVTFPDFNSDGYKDIRVAALQDREDRAIELVYVPNPEGGAFWQVRRMDSKLSATYKPSGISYNSP